jgi:hypothetical protein
MAHNFPITPLVLVDGSIETPIVIRQVPFTVGRLPDRDLVLSHPYVSRKHAEIVYEGGDFLIVDSGSRHGTFINGVRVQRQPLMSNDSIHFGSLDGPVLKFDVQGGGASGSTIRDLLGQIQSMSAPNTDLEKLRWFLEAARKLNTVGAVDQILASLVETTLQLTKVERGYVFLNQDGELHLAVGRSSVGESLVDDSTISHSAIQQATRTAGEYIVTDTLTAEIGTRSDSMVAQSIRTVICIPLRRRRNEPSRTPGVQDSAAGEILGVLYLDSRLSPGNLTQVDNDLLKTIATEAAALIDNAQLAIAEEHARRYREELNIAASIQQNLMTVQIPELPYARISARSIP